MKTNEQYPLFSNGTEFMLWQSRNCEQCVKAVFYNTKKDYFPKYKCAIQRDIESASIGDGCGNRRVYEATHSVECPYKRTSKPNSMVAHNSESFNPNEIESLYRQYEDAKEFAEQHTFLLLLLFDKTIQEEYSDLQQNFTKEKASLFVKNVKWMLKQIA